MNLEIGVLLYFIGLSTAYSFAHFGAKWLKDEEFSVNKLIRTIVIGIIIGAIAAIRGVELTFENWTILLASTGALMWADRVVIFAERLFKKYLGTNPFK